MNNPTAPLTTDGRAVEDGLPGTALLSAATVTGNEVCNMQDEKLGKIQDIMLDLTEGKIRYAVLSSGGFLGMGDRLFAVPWKALKLDRENHRFLLNVDIERLKNAPGFDKDQWPDMADSTWSSTIESYYIR
ncbi:PRC-barrel domain-containing protein [Marinospirillum alkaliphilum]|uniref:PRC-barrel domain-containing protein n=1 Tax=Marinospirillum alkaliphilum DSM 21637 TaxID=1122209 RepID=A0A1K1VUP0_9GAMM|nr:PRC-barrel domain-containing protein [Marinospirillum alkaliphilum]SFX28929.1 PRC-barrel domain-containing protein [Marinospirillum alkaliphilum DSM 21637]